MFINFHEVSTLLPKFQHCCRYSQFCCPNLERPLDFVRGKSNTVDKATLTALNSTLLRVCTGLTMISTSLGNSGLCWTVFTRNRDTSVPAEGNGDLQTLICVLEARPRRCLTLSNPVPSKLNGGLSRLHSADEDAVLWLTSYGSWNVYEKKILVVTMSVVFLLLPLLYCTVCTNGMYRLLYILSY